ncbi:MAG TPA: bifunctional diguanylate cyclase/phosphodiesterase [Solirubrobacteraceae bacterium]
MVPIETDDHVLRARRTAASTRAILGLTGIALALAQPSLLPHPVLAVVGFATITTSATVQLMAPGMSWLKAEESLAGAAAILIVGLGDQRVTILSVLWLAAVASGVMARGGRVHWIGRTVVLSALALPVIRQGHLSADQAALTAAAIGLLLTSGRLTRELNHLLRRARWDADHDDLTGLLSRAAFRTVLDEATAAAGESNPISLLLLDLDGFGLVNKTVGHAAGDKLLASFGGRLRTAVDASRPAGRLGGDEFALIVPGADALPLAEQLLATLPRDGEDFRGISASVGIAQAPRDGSDAEALLRAGDIALRVAKRSGTGGQISTYVGQSLSGSGEQSARGALTRLIEGDGLAMAVQPIVDLRTGSVHAYEALARLGAAGTGSPLQWFSLADEFGERDALERACLRAALQLFARRPQGMRLSVNLSAPVLLDRRTLRILDQPADLSGLIIEVTEEALVQSDAQLRAAMAPLRARGARLAVDDVGAGYSGLRQLTTVHPSYMKLDRSLVSGIDHDSERAALVSALVGYAERVGSLLVAEGIENEAELLALRKLGAPLAQGFYLGRPGPPWPAVSSERSIAPSAIAPAEVGGSTLAALQPALG